MRHISLTILLLLAVVPAAAELPFNAVRFFNAVPGTHVLAFDLNNITIAEGTPYLRASRYVDILDGTVNMNGNLLVDGAPTVNLLKGMWSGHQTWIALDNGTGFELLRATTNRNNDRSICLAYVVHGSHDIGNVTLTYDGGIPNQMSFGGVAKDELTPGRYRVRLMATSGIIYDKIVKMPRRGVIMLLFTGSVSSTVNPLQFSVINEKGKPVRVKPPLIKS